MENLLFQAEGIGTGNDTDSEPGDERNPTTELWEHSAAALARNPCGCPAEESQARCCCDLDARQNSHSHPEQRAIVCTHEAVFSLDERGSVAAPSLDTRHLLAEPPALATSLGTHYRQIGLAVPPNGELQCFTPRGEALSAYWRTSQLGRPVTSTCVGELDPLEHVANQTVLDATSSQGLTTPAEHHEKGIAEPVTTQPVFRIVLTGGPCAGKTTAMALLAERFRSRGFRVFLVPEAATLLFTGGAGQANITGDSECRILFQSILARLQITLEDGFFALAQQCRAPSIVLCDRGFLDGRAYMSGDEYTEMLGQNAWNLIEMRDQRYDAVLHLVTAADGAESFYTCEGHAARSESLREARQVDARTREAWSGHPRLYVIENRNRWLAEHSSTCSLDEAPAAAPPNDQEFLPLGHCTPSPGFAEKMERLFSIVCRLVGLPTPAHMLDRKFLLTPDASMVNHLRADPHVRGLQTFRVEQTFLIRAQASSSNDKSDPKNQSQAPVFWASQQEHVRRRGRDGFHSYTHCIRRRYAEWSHQQSNPISERKAQPWVELRRNISLQEYHLLLGYADPRHRTLLVWRSCFFYHNAYFVLDQIENANVGPVALLRTSASSTSRSGSTDAPTPAGLPLSNCVRCEVTADARYAFYALSRRCPCS